MFEDPVEVFYQRDFLTQRRKGAERENFIFYPARTIAVVTNYDFTDSLVQCPVFVAITYCRHGPGHACHRPALPAFAHFIIKSVFHLCSSVAKALSSLSQAIPTHPNLSHQFLEKKDCLFFLSAVRPTQTAAQQRSPAISPRLCTVFSQPSSRLCKAIQAYSRPPGGGGHAHLNTAMISISPTMLLFNSGNSSAGIQSSWWMVSPTVCTGYFKMKSVRTRKRVT